MVKCDLRLDVNNLHNDLNAIRNVRDSIQHDEEWGIRLLWKDAEGRDHQLLVCVKGPALSVERYITTGETTVNFIVGSYNYQDKDKGCLLWLSEITTILELLESGKVTQEMIESSERNDTARTAYVMCVFVASEIVRNEVLEAILLKATDESIETTWRNYRLLYKNWASVSGALYDREQSERAPVIRLRDMKAAFLAGTLRDDILEIYHDIFNGILGNFFHKE